MGSGIEQLNLNTNGTGAKDDSSYAGSLRIMREIFAKKPDLQFKVGEFIIGWDKNKKQFIVQTFNGGTPIKSDALSNPNGVRKIFLNYFGPDVKNSEGQFPVFKQLKAIQDEPAIAQWNIVDLRATIKDGKFFRYYKDEEQAVFAKAGNRYAQGNYTGAIQEIQNISENKRTPEMLYYLAQSYEKLGDIKKAYDIYKQGLALAPQNNRSYFQEAVARCEKQIGQPQKPAAIASPPTKEPIRSAQSVKLKLNPSGARNAEPAKTPPSPKTPVLIARSEAPSPKPTPAVPTISAKPAGTPTAVAPAKTAPKPDSDQAVIDIIDVKILIRTVELNVRTKPEYTRSDITDAKKAVSSAKDKLKGLSQNNQEVKGLIRQVVLLEAFIQGQEDYLNGKHADAKKVFEGILKDADQNSAAHIGSSRILKIIIAKTQPSAPAPKPIAVASQPLPVVVAKPTPETPKPAPVVQSPKPAPKVVAPPKPKPEPKPQPAVAAKPAAAAQSPKPAVVVKPATIVTNVKPTAEQRQLVTRARGLEKAGFPKGALTILQKAFGTGPIPKEIKLYMDRLERKVSEQDRTAISATASSSKPTVSEPNSDIARREKLLEARQARVSNDIRRAKQLAQQFSDLGLPIKDLLDNADTLNNASGDMSDREFNNMHKKLLASIKYSEIKFAQSKKEAENKRKVAEQQEQRANAIARTATQRPDETPQAEVPNPQSAKQGARFEDIPNGKKWWMARLNDEEKLLEDTDILFHRRNGEQWVPITKREWLNTKNETTRARIRFEDQEYKAEVQRGIRAQFEPALVVLYPRLKGIFAQHAPHGSKIRFIISFSANLKDSDLKAAARDKRNVEVKVNGIKITSSENIPAEKKTQIERALKALKVSGIKLPAELFAILTSDGNVETWHVSARTFHVGLSM